MCSCHCGASAGALRVGWASSLPPAPGNGDVQPRARVARPSVAWGAGRTTRRWLAVVALAVAVALAAGGNAGQQSLPPLIAADVSNDDSLLEEAEEWEETTTDEPTPDSADVPRNYVSGTTNFLSNVVVHENGFHYVTMTTVEPMPFEIVIGIKNDFKCDVRVNFVLDTVPPKLPKRPDPSKNSGPSPVVRRDETPISEQLARIFASMLFYSTYCATMRGVQFSIRESVSNSWTLLIDVPPSKEKARCTFFLGYQYLPKDFEATLHLSAYLMLTFLVAFVIVLAFFFRSRTGLVLSLPSVLFMAEPVMRLARVAEMAAVSGKAYVMERCMPSETTSEGECTDEEGDVCRICHEGGRREPLIEPCQCTGSCRHVHASCLTTWRLESHRVGNWGTQRCEICNADFNIPVPRRLLLATNAKKIGMISAWAAFGCFLFIAHGLVMFAIMTPLSCTAPWSLTDISVSLIFFSIFVSTLLYIQVALTAHAAANVVALTCRTMDDLEWNKRRVCLAILLTLLLLVSSVFLSFILKIVAYLRIDTTVWVSGFSPIGFGLAWLMLYLPLIGVNFVVSKITQRSREAEMNEDQLDAPLVETEEAHGTAETESGASDADHGEVNQIVEQGENNTSVLIHEEADVNSDEEKICNPSDSV